MADRDRRAVRRAHRARLRDTAPGGDPLERLVAGLEPEQTAGAARAAAGRAARAAVLVPLVERPEGLTVLLTQRASHLKHHPGQISFPGGRIEAERCGPVGGGAARDRGGDRPRAASYVSLAGYLRDHLVITGLPASRRPSASCARASTLRLDLTEVEDVVRGAARVRARPGQPRAARAALRRPRRS